ncbi:MAG: hypothetical protein HOO97_00425 [Sideroxydans sp.]|nr:hypothetical protein [Sideroxydans sp.]NOT97551.1 hypothetical protein [Sideroxydans sp.]
MKTVMNKMGYEIESLNAYDDEVMNTGWNPQLSLMTNGVNEPMEKHHSMLPTLANVDVDTFLNVMYRAQR